MRVLLKPNLLARYAPDAAVTTHPVVVEAVVLVLQGHGIDDITLADSPGGPYAKSLLETIYRASGLAAVAERTGMKLNTDTATVEKTVADAELCRSFTIIKPAIDADYIINLVKLKTHGMMMMTAGVKNLFGCIPGLMKPDMHLRFPEKERFAQMLVDLALLVKPGITLVDGIDAMEGDGPSGGTVRHMGMTFAAKNVFALDLALGEFLGFGCDEVPTVAQSVKAGLCPANPTEIEWLLDGKPRPILDFQHPHSKTLSFSGSVPKWLSAPVGWLEKRLSPRPVVNRGKCIGCGKCAESCAPRAMTVRDKKANLELSKCIRCYCCHEMCPVNAIKIKRSIKS
jgi:uncharacterized protein (DUF362 family)/ferredoxin